MISKIFYARNGAALGPFSLNEFHALNLPEDTYVWFEGMANWELLKNVREVLTPKVSGDSNPINIKLLTELQRRLKIGNRRGVHLNAIPQKSRYKFDLHRLSYIDKNLPDQFIQSLLTELPLKFKISWKNNVPDFNALFEEDKKQLVNISKSLENLINQTETIELEKGINTFGFGFPILIRRDLADKKLTVAPLFIWALKIKETKEFNTWEICRNEDDPIYLNEVLINHLSNDAGITIEQISNEMLDDGLISKSELLEICFNLIKSVNTQVPDHIYDTFQQELNSVSAIKERDEYEKITENSHVSVIQFSGLFSIFEVQKQNIIHDYQSLLTLDNLNLLPQNPIVHSFQSLTGMETDPSQQSILHALEDGGKILIQGPPGTGKSQTLTAILINALENHKKTIVVCEKKTALEVLENTLTNFGLEHHLILLKDTVKDRKKVVDAARNRMDQLGYRYQEHDFSKEELSKLLQKANGFIQGINKRHRKLNVKQLKNKNWTDLVGELLMNLQQIQTDSPLQYEAKNFLFNAVEFEEISQIIDRAALLYQEFKPFRDLKILNEALYREENPYHLHHQIKTAINSYKTKIEHIKELEIKIKTHFFQSRNEEFQTALQILRNYLDSVSVLVHKYEQDPLFYDELKTRSIGFRIAAIFSGNKRQYLKDQRIIKNLFPSIGDFLKQTKDLDSIVLRDSISENIRAVQSLESYFQKAPYLSDSSLEMEFGAFNLLGHPQPKDPTESLVSLKNEVEQLFNLIEVDNCTHFTPEKHTYKEFLEGVENLIEKTETFLNRIEDPFLHQFNWYQFYLKQPDSYKSLLDALSAKEDWKRSFSICYIHAFLHHIASEDLPSNDYDHKELITLLGNLDTAQLRYIKEHWNFRLLKQAAAFENKHPTLSIENLYNKRSSIKYKRLTLRQIVQFDVELFTTFFPIILTSPDVCSNLFKGKNGYFDIVMFDEASQLRLEDNLPAILKGKQIIISGDEHQMPPSNYFGKIFDGAIEDEDDLDEEEEVIKIDKDNILLSCESLLDFGGELSFEKCHLDFHYRSKHPFLIDFSNHAFYRRRLQPLPNPHHYQPIQWIQVDGIYKDYGNEEEAEMILEILDKQIQKFPNGKYPSVGIATFNITQRNLIKSKIIDRRKLSKYSAFNEKIQALEGEGFFLKNLENIQGDERDIIILSTTFGRTKEGKFFHRFGPINLTKGYKLLNVIITRAKFKIFVCTSVPQEIYLNYREYLKKEGANNRGAVFFAYLAYCRAVSEGNHAERAAVLQALDENSPSEKKMHAWNESSHFPFGKAVYQTIADTFGEDHVQAPFQFAGFTLDILYDPKIAGVPRLAIECDGSKKHDQREAYLYDLHRKKILEKSGFIFLSIWSVNWWRNPELEKSKLIAFIRELSNQKIQNEDQMPELDPSPSIEIPIAAESPISTSIVSLNSVVRVKYIEMNKIISVQIVEQGIKNDLKEGIQKISKDSPLAVALLGNREGDLVKIGKLDNFVEILKID
jgi:DNA polymerase III delta prime subunit